MTEEKKRLWLLVIFGSVGFIMFLLFLAPGVNPLITITLGLIGTIPWWALLFWPRLGAGFNDRRRPARRRSVGNTWNKWDNRRD
jgi:hypothetical protein